MKNLNDTPIRMQLVHRYLNAETTIEEEQQLLPYYAETDNTLTPEERDVRLLLLSSAQLTGEFALSEEKAGEFDQLMAKKPAKRIALYWIVSATAAVILVFFLLTNKQVDNVPNQPQVASVSQKEIAKPLQQETVTANPPVAVEPEQAITERHTPKQPKRKPHRSAPAITEQQVNNMMSATNYTNEQVESYRLQPVGDATIVTKTCSDGTSASYIVCLSDDNEGLHVVPINIEM
ncbi:MAG: hypothetical protein IJ647_08600 [Prevotella sp.]|nr:hypothetical protein [Prevotella sp.]